jgi:hypothetical protein
MEADPSFLAVHRWDVVTILQRLSADTHLVAGHAGRNPYLRGPNIDA